MTTEEEAAAAAASGTEETAPSEKKKDAPESKADASVVQAVAERLRFFFSNANLRHDLYLRRPLMSSKGSYAHQVLVTNLLKFNTIKQHTTDASVVVQAAQSLPELLTVSSDSKAIGRVEEFTESMMHDNVPLTLHVRNLPVKDGQYQVTPDEVRALFTQYGEVAIVKLRYTRADKEETPSKKEEETPGKDTPSKETPSKDSSAETPKKRHVPAGAAFVEFASSEARDQAAAEVVTQTRDGDGTVTTCTPARVLTLHDATLSVERMEGFLWKKKRNKDETDDTPVTPKEPFTLDWKTGCVLRLQELPKDCDREAILDAMATGLNVTVNDVKDRKVYVDYSRGQPEGAIRFQEPHGMIQTLLTKFQSGDLEIANSKVKAHLLEGDEESKYWEDFIEFKNKQRQHKHHERSSRKRARHSK